MSDEDKYSFELIDNEADARTCAQLIADELAANDPLTVFEKVPTQRVFDQCSWPAVKGILDQRLSFLARDRTKNQIVAVVCMGDLYTTYQHYREDHSINEETIGVDDLVRDMVELFVERDYGQELKPNTVLHIILAAIRSEEANKGVISYLCIMAGRHARDTKGFKWSLTQTTNSTSRHIIVNKMGGKEVSVVDPATWQWKRKGDGLSCPYKDYKGGVISNILLTLDETEHTDRVLGKK